MQVGNVQNTLIAFALFDMWTAGMNGVIQKQQQQQADPLVAAAGAAFQNYINIMEGQHAAQISGVAAYALSPSGKAAVPVSTQQMAPFLALNVMA